MLSCISEVATAYRTCAGGIATCTEVRRGSGGTKYRKLPKTLDPASEPLCRRTETLDLLSTPENFSRKSYPDVSYHCLYCLGQTASFFILPNGLASKLLSNEAVIMIYWLTYIPVTAPIPTGTDVVAVVKVLVFGISVTCWLSVGSVFFAATNVQTRYRWSEIVLHLLLTVGLTYSKISWNWHNAFGILRLNVFNRAVILMC